MRRVEEDTDDRSNDQLLVAAHIKLSRDGREQDAKVGKLWTINIDRKEILDLDFFL